MSEALNSSALYSRAMIANLSINQWNGLRTDREITDSVHRERNMDKKAGKYVLKLLPDEFFAPIQKVVSAARVEHLRMTSPWLDNDGRILSVKAYDHYTATLARMESEFRSVVIDRADNALESAKDEAKRILNGSYDESLYPTRDGFIRRYRWHVRIFPVPRGSDFRVELGDAQAQMIRDDIERAAQETVAATQADLYGRVGKVVSVMIDRLGAYKPGNDSDRAKGAFHGSLVENIRDLAELIPTLNITDDPRLSDLAARLTGELCEHDAKQLKDSDNLRIGTAAKAQAILDEVSAYM